MHAAAVALVVAAQAAAAGVESARSAVLAFEAEFAAAWNAHDAQRMASKWADDGDLINPFGRVARGRQDIERLFREEHAGVMRASRYAFKLDGVRMVSPDVAVTDWTNTIEGMTAPDGTALPAFPHHVTSVFVRRAGQWRVYTTRVMQFLPPPPAPPAPRTSMTAEPSSAASSQILTLEKQWAEALVKSDLDALGRLYADDLVYVHSGGNVETKAQFLDRVRAGGLKYQKLDLVNPRARVYGDGAVVTGTFDVSVLVDGQPVNTKVVYTHVYGRQDGQWRLVAHQTTRLPAQP